MDQIIKKPLARLPPHAEDIFSVAFSPDGKYLASGGASGSVRLWNAATYEQVNCFIDHQDAVTALLFTPDGEGLWSGSMDGTVRLWSIKSCYEQRQFNEHYGGVTSLAFTSDGKTLLAGGNNGTLSFWNLKSPAESFDIEMYGPISCVCNLPGGIVMAIARVGDEHYEQFPDVEPATISTFYEDGQYCETEQLPGTICAAASKDFVVYGGSGPPLGVLSGDFDIHDIPTANQLANGTYARAIFCYHATSPAAQIGFGSEWWTAHYGDILSLALSPSGRLLASASADKSVKLWSDLELEGGEADLCRIFQGHTAAVRKVAFSPDGRTLASAGDNSVLLWDLRDLED